MSKKLSSSIKQHLVDSTAILAESNPLFVALELGVANLSVGASINARLLATATFYGGLGYLFGKGRDISKNHFNITDETSEKIQHLHDSAYGAGFSALLSPPMYALSQKLAGDELDLTKIALATGSAVTLGIINGNPSAYAIDLFRDLSGVKDCNRKLYPKFLKNRTPKVKKAIFVALTAASIGAMAMQYACSNNNQSTNPTLEQITQE